MNNRNLFIIALVALAACAFVYFEKDRPGTVAARERERYLLDLKADQVDRVELTNPSGTYIFARNTQGGWDMESPVVYPADASNVGNLLSDLEFAQRVGVVRREGDDDFAELLGRFGLTEPRILVRLVRGKNVQTLAVGGQTARPGTYYALVNDGRRKEIVLIDSMLEGQFVEAADYWRSRDLIDFSPAEVQAVVVRENGRESEMKKTDGVWQVTRPLDLTADLARVNRYLGEVRKLRAERFVAEAGADLSGFGFSPPSGTIDLVTSEGSRTVVFGGVVPDAPDQIYAQPAGRGNVVAVSARARNLLDLLARVRPRNVLEWPLDQTPLSVEITSGSGSFLISRPDTLDGTWSVTQGEWRSEADPAEVQGLLSQLRALEALEFLESKENPSAVYGLGRPVVTLVMRFSESANLPAEQTLRFGANRQGETFLESSQVPYIVTVAQSFIDTLPKQPWDFLPEEVTVAAPDQIIRVTWQGGGPSMTVEKDADGKWAAGGMKEPFDEMFFMQQTEMLNALRITEWLGPPAPRDFARPRLTLTVATADQEKKVLFGARRADGTVPVRIEGHAFAFSIPEDTFQALALRPVTQPPAKR